MSSAESRSSMKLIGTVLIVVAAASAAGRIASATKVFEPQLYKDVNDPADVRGTWPATRPAPMPNFGSNDTSRWATVRALVDEGTFVIGRRDPVKGDTGIVFENGWWTVDKVLHPERQEFYSSKPPLLPTFVAGIYWLLQFLTGWTLKENTFSVMRTILMAINLVPFVVYLALLARLLQRWAVSDWCRFFILAAACFATLVSPFLVCFNNHTIATCCALFALYPVIDYLRFPWDRSHKTPSLIALAISGFFAGITASVELPAAAFAGLLFVVLLFQAPQKTLLAFLPLLVLPFAVELWLNHQVIGDLNFVYSKKFEAEQTWYEYADSPWKKNVVQGQKTGSIDFAKYHEGRLDYVYHVFIGHHGLFSLTPIWLLAFVGMLGSLMARGKRGTGLPPCPDGSGDPSYSAVEPDRKALACFTLLVTAVIFAFYLITTDNYGGGTSGMRWFMWLSPLWLLTMAPVVDWLGERRWGRWFALFLLACSVFSASFPTWNPWRHPWLYQLMDSRGLIPY